MTDFLLSKRAQQPQPSYTPTPNIVIEPVDPLVQQAVNKIKQTDPNFFLQVEKIVVHFGGGAGHLGYVKRGPDDNPRVIHIYKDRIKEIIQRDLGGNMNAANFEQAVQAAIAEVIGHERAHIGEKPEEFFHDEPEAERGGAEILQKIKPQFVDDLLNASLVLDDIRKKYLPNTPMSEPNLPFVIYCKHANNKQIIREGIKILCADDMSPVVLEIQEARQFNKDKINTFAKRLGLIEKIAGIDFDTDDFVLRIAEFQILCGLKPTGKINEDIFKKVANIRFSEFPKNFGIVIPGKLYRGALIDRPIQLRALRDQCGVQRVVSLHDNFEMPRICSFLGIEHVPAHMERCSIEEPGRRVFEDSVSEFLLQKPTYIHCYYGQDRTGGVIARLRTEMGWPCKLAYLEAKSYGFKDIFADFIDWFCEPTGESPPVNTDKIRMILGDRSPYVNPELTQNLLEPTPTDLPFGNPYDELSNHTYLTWADTVNNITPMSITPPIPTGSHGV